MKPRDTLQRFVFEHAAIRGEIVHLDSAWRAVLERHDYPPAVRNLLGELMAAAVLLSAMLKFNGSMILQIQGNGPVNLLVVESTSERTLRGMAQWSGELASMPFPQLVGQGKFVITIDPKEEGQRYQGIVSIEGETVSEALENYLARSEQIDSRLWLAADTEQAAGMLLQKCRLATMKMSTCGSAPHTSAPPSPATNFWNYRRATYSIGFITRKICACSRAKPYASTAVARASAS